MSATPPEADIEYSRARGRPRGAIADGAADPTAPAGGAIAAPPGRIQVGISVCALLGAALLLAAEPAPLSGVRTLGGATIRTVSTGAHHGYALVPIALAAAALTVASLRYGWRLALPAVGALGLAALVIALALDLPDARATGLTGSSATRYLLATSRPAVGLYLETLGAVLLLLASGLGVLCGARVSRALPRGQWFAS